MGSLQTLGTLKEFLVYTSSPWRNRVFRRFPRVKAARVLGIACTGHGASLGYIDTAGNIRASQLERWTNVKHMMMFSADEDDAIRHPKTDIDESINFIFRLGFGRLPDSCIFEEKIVPWTEWLLRGVGVGPNDIDLVVTSDSHFATGWMRLGPVLRRWFPNARVVRNLEHHEIHQRQAFWSSGFEEAAVLTLDTCGEKLPRLRGRQLCGTISVMDQDGRSRVLREFLFPEMSSGLLFDTTTHHVGFRQGDEGKTMGLAAFGEPELWTTLRPHLRLLEDGGFEFLRNDAFQVALDAYVPARDPEAEMTQRHEDVAYAGQALVDAIVTNAWRAALALTGRRDLVYAGGVALNSVANGIAYREVRPDRVYIAPNPGDPGHGLGCALFGAYELAKWAPPAREVPEFLGPPYPDDAIEAAVSGRGFDVQRPDDPAVPIARCIANGHIVARFSDHAEFGPRALGNRSILCDPRRPGMKDYLNLRVKHREPFRPFAPTVLQEFAADWFAMTERSAYMLRVAPIHPEKLPLVPAIAHVDGSARVQTLARDENPGYWRVVTAFHEMTGVPLILNTSFNLAGKPIVETPQDAVACFTATEIDVLAIGPYIVSKRPLTDYLTTSSGA